MFVCLSVFCRSLRIDREFTFKIVCTSTIKFKPDSNFVRTDKQYFKYNCENQ